MDVENGSLNTKSEIDDNFFNIPNLEVDVKIEKDYVDDDDDEIELNTDHIIKEDMDIGPVEYQRVFYRSNYYSDAPAPKRPKLDQLDEYLKQDHQKETSECNIVDIPSIVDINKNANSDIQSKDKRPKKSGTCKKNTGEEILLKDISLVGFICDDCNKLFDTKHELVKHIKHHEKIRRKVYMKCKVCTYQTFTRSSFKRHLKLHDKNRNYVCGVCGYRYQNIYYLQSHVKRNHTNKKKMRTCKFCNHATEDKTMLKKHLLEMHSDEKLHSDLTGHLLIHDNENDDKIFSCEVCDYRCNTKEGMTKHMRTHTGEKPFSCPVCEYKCSQKSHLTAHLKIHTGEKPFACSLCNYKCITQNTLNNHIRIHTGEKPFSCNVCYYKCITKSALTKHLMIHSGEKPYPCLLCDYKCTKRADLDKHVRVHTGEKPFSCNVCSYKTAQKNALRIHMKTHEKSKAELQRRL